MTDLAHPAAPALERTRSLALLSNARAALAAADTLPEIVTVVDQAEVVRVAARKARLGRAERDRWASSGWMPPGKPASARRAGQLHPGRGMGADEIRES
jgi:hypothetical protein